MKEFEKEYRQMIQEEMPDLWGRIEAGLQEKAAGGQGRITVKPGNITGESNTGEGKRKFTAKQRYYMGVAAACLCGAVLITGAFGIGESGRSDSASPSAMDAAAADMPAEEWQEEAVVTGSTENASAEEASGYADGAEAAESAGTAEETGNMAAEETDGSGALTEHIVSAADGGAEGTGMPDQTVTEHVRVKILEVTNMQYHKLYRAAVLQDDSGWLPEGAELCFLSDPADEMEEGAEYQVSFVYNEGAEVPFRLLEYKETEDI